MLLSGSQKPFLYHIILCQTKIQEPYSASSGGWFEDRRALWGSDAAPHRPASALIEVNNNNTAEGRDSTQRAAEQP